MARRTRSVGRTSGAGPDGSHGGASGRSAISAGSMVRPRRHRNRRPFRGAAVGSLHPSVHAAHAVAIVASGPAWGRHRPDRELHEVRRKEPRRRRLATEHDPSRRLPPFASRSALIRIVYFSSATVPRSVVPFRTAPRRVIESIVGGVIHATKLR